MDDTKLDRRGLLECMAWVGTGVVWTVAGGVPRSALIGSAEAAAMKDGFTFAQISDSHIGFNKEANPDVAGTLKAAIDAGPLAAEAAGLHDPHRRRHPPLQAGGVRHRRPADRRRRPRPARRAGRARHAGGRRAGLPPALRQGHQGDGLVQLRPRRGPLRRPRQRRRPQARRHGPARRRAARVAGGRPEGPHGRDARRRLRPHPALVGLPGLGLGHRRLRPRRWAT